MHPYLEQLFYTYWNSDARNDCYNGRFQNLQEYASMIILNDPDMDWMDDPKTAIIIYHIIYMELNLMTTPEAKAWASLKENEIFVEKNNGKNPVLPYPIKQIALNKKESHDLVDEQINVEVISTYLLAENQQDVDKIKNSYLAIERFLEQQRRLFNTEVEFHAHNMIARMWSIIRSSQTGHWETLEQNGKKHTGSFQEICNHVLDSKESLN